MTNRIEKTEVVDPYTVKITLKAPFSAFVNVLAHPSAVMISPDALKKYGKDIAFHPVGTGPFELVKWDPAGDLTVKKFYLWIPVPTQGFFLGQLSPSGRIFNFGRNEVLTRDPRVDI